jgi:hypothetical protein
MGPQTALVLPILWDGAVLGNLAGPGLRKDIAGMEALTRRLPCRIAVFAV